MRARVLTAAALTTIGVTAGAGPASAATWGAGWYMQQRTVPMVDSVNHNDSTSIGAGITRPGDWYRFAGLGVVRVPDDATLRPYRRPFIVVAKVDFFEGGDRNIVQKGQYGTSRTAYKMEIDGSSIVCAFRGTRGAATVKALHRSDVIARSGFTVVRCRKRPGSIGIRIGNEPWITRSVRIGSIDNRVPLTIGGKINNSHHDYFMGRIDRVVVRAL